MKKIIVLLVVCILGLSLVSCSDRMSYEEARTEHEDVFNGYFTLIKEWRSDTGAYYRIVYANDTGVMYFVFSSGYQGGMTPLYNADGTLQIYDEE